MGMDISDLILGRCRSGYTRDLIALIPIIRGKKPNVRPFFKNNFQLKKLVSISEPNVRPFFKKN